MPPTDKEERPSWWTADHDVGWESARPAVKASWGKHTEGDTNAAAGWTAAEPALRFGHGARRQYDTTGKVSWAEVEPRLQADWTNLKPAHSWPAARKAVMHGWDSHTRAGLHANPTSSGGPRPSGLGGSSAGDSGSGSGDA